MGELVHHATVPARPAQISGGEEAVSVSAMAVYLQKIGEGITSVRRAAACCTNAPAS